MTRHEAAYINLRTRRSDNNDLHTSVYLVAPDRTVKMILFVELTVALVTVGLFLFAYFKWILNYWKRKNMSQLNPRIPWGDVENPLFLKKGLAAKIAEAYDVYKSKGLKHGGFYMMSQPMYVPVDPDYIKNILAKDFQYFMSRGIYFNEKADPLSAHLVSIEGQKWKHLRAKLTPTFTSGKMKMMFQTLLDCGDQLREEMDKIQAQQRPADIKELVACFTTDIIGSCAFGLECNSFKDPDAEFRKYGRKVFQPTLERTLKRFFAVSVPNFCRLIGMSLTPKDVRVFFMNVVQNVVAYREGNDIVRNDFVQILLDLKNKRTDELPPLTINEMAAQAFIFFLAGFETSSTTLTFCFYELAKHLDIQQKVRDEISSVIKRYEGKLTYEGIMEMKYLQQVIDETLRKYPPVPILPRVCNKNYKIPETDIVLEKGTKVLISVLGLHRDPEYYPDPERFDPDRFLEENKANRHPFTFLPFGEGPRNCIGLRFGLMQTKIGVALMLQNYRLTLNEKTPEHITLDPRSGLTSTLENVLLNIEKLNV